MKKSTTGSAGSWGRFEAVRRFFVYSDKYGKEVVAIWGKKEKEILADL